MERKVNEGEIDYEAERWKGEEREERGRKVRDKQREVKRDGRKGEQRKERERKVREGEIDNEVERYGEKGDEEE